MQFGGLAVLPTDPAALRELVLLILAECNAVSALPDAAVAGPDDPPVLNACYTSVRLCQVAVRSRVVGGLPQALCPLDA